MHLSAVQKPSDRKAIQFPEWKSVLAPRPEPEPLKARLRRAVFALLRFCKIRRRPADAVIIREFLAAIPAGRSRDGVREALAWFYTHGKHQPAVPAGGEDWTAGLDAAVTSVQC